MLQVLPWVVGIVGVWFLIAYFANSSMVRAATGARPLTRRENPRVYNIVENLCMTCNMDMPQINIVNDPQLNAFASGIDKKSYTVTVTTGLLTTSWRECWATSSPISATATPVCSSRASSSWASSRR